LDKLIDIKKAPLFISVFSLLYPQVFPRNWFMFNSTFNLFGF